MEGSTHPRTGQRDPRARSWAVRPAPTCPDSRQTATQAGDTAPGGMPIFGALCGSRSLGSCVAEAPFSLACPFPRLTLRGWGVGGGEGGPVGGEGEGGPVGGEGEGGRLGLFSSPLPGLFPLPTLGSSPLLPGTLGLITGASAGEQTLGDTLARRRMGMGGRRAAAAVPPSPALISLSCFSSTQPVSLRGRRGWECSRAACASARGARSLSRGHGGSGEYLARARTISRYTRRCP